MMQYRCVDKALSVTGIKSLGASPATATISHHLFLTAVVAALTACGGGGGSDPLPTEKFAKVVEDLQCEAPRVTPAQLDSELVTVGAKVLSKSCAWDGRMYPAVCGAPTTYLQVIEIAQNQADLVRPLGYKTLAEFSEVHPMDCPAT